MKIFIVSDHAGYRLKTKIVEFLETHHEVVDLGPQSDDRVDYPDFADRVLIEYRKVIQDYKKTEDSIYLTQCYCILICGSGQGMAMRANKYNNIRAALCWNEDSAQLSREHNNANVLCLGARYLNFQSAMSIILQFQSSKFTFGRHTDRVLKISRNIES